MREIGVMNEVAKEFISAVNQGYLHGPCRNAAVSVSKSLVGLEKQFSVLIESTEGDEYQSLLCRATQYSFYGPVPSVFTLKCFLWLVQWACECFWCLPA